MLHSHIRFLRFFLSLIIYLNKNCALFECVCSALCVCVCVVFNIIYGLPLRAWIIGLTESYFTRKTTPHRSVRWNIRQGKPGEIYRPMKHSQAQMCKFKQFVFNGQTHPIPVYVCVLPILRKSIGFCRLVAPRQVLNFLHLNF